MFEHITLRFRLTLLITAIALINLFGPLITVWYTHRTQNMYTDMIDKDLSALTAAQKLETALVMQKGLATYFFLTGSDDWLDKLENRHADFTQWLNKARDVNQEEGARSILNEIESRYIRYAYARDQVIRLYQDGKRELGAQEHWKVRDQFFVIYNLVDKFKSIHEKSITQMKAGYGQSARNMSLLAWGAIPSGLFLTLLLVFILFKQVLAPIRQLAIGTGSEPHTFLIDNEVNALKHRMSDLVMDIDTARTQLAESQAHLVQTEKLAMVGKLAAGVAHSVRNPLTSVKMRLFTLERNLTLTPAQKDDLEVISEEIRHIDTILGNFLEFSRPPKLEFRQVSPSDVVDTTLQLLKHRLESYQTKVIVDRKEKLPETPVDADQLKEVLVNIMINACEAMGDKGEIRVTEKQGIHDPYGKVITIRIADTGPGIPLKIQEKIFEPFFSSKEEGSGLGLSIARRIIEDHGGKIYMESVGERGTVFVILLPIEEEKSYG